MHGDERALYAFKLGAKLLFAGVNIDPSEEKLRTEFEGVQRSFIPMHAVIRIDEVEKEGVAKITSTDGGTVTAFPMPVPTDR